MVSYSLMENMQPTATEQANSILEDVSLLQLENTKQNSEQPK